MRFISPCLKKIYFISFILTFHTVYSKPGSTNEKVVRDFVVAINSHSTEKISALMTEGHLFTDAQNYRIIGKERVTSGWKGYLEWFPDYKIEVEKIISDKDTFAVFGFAQGTFHNLKQDSTRANWRLPASWKVIVQGNKIALWQVYADTKIPFEIIERYASSVDSQKVMGFGGVFFKSKNPKELREWYDKHLGTTFGKQGYFSFAWRERDNKEKIGSTAFTIFKETSDYFSPSESRFMFNFRVKDLDAFMARLKKENVNVIEKTENYDFGKFGWVIDPDGNKIELWEPKNE